MVHVLSSICSLALCPSLGFLRCRFTRLIITYQIGGPQEAEARVERRIERLKTLQRQKDGRGRHADSASPSPQRRSERLDDEGEGIGLDMRGRRSQRFDLGPGGY